MSTTYTPTAAEVAVFQKFVDDNHILCDGSDQGNKNVELIRDFVIGQMKQTALTEVALKAALPHIQSKLTLKTKAQQALEKVVASISSSERQTFMTWFNRQGRLVTDDESNEAIENAANILTWAASHGGANEKNFDLALGNLPMKGIAVHYKPAPSTFTGGRHSGRKFDHFSKDATNGQGRTTHADNPAYQNKPKEEAVVEISADEAKWRDLANGLRGHTHSVNAELDAVTGTSWRSVYDQRLAIIRRGERVGR